MSIYSYKKVENQNSFIYQVIISFLYFPSHCSGLEIQINPKSSSRVLSAKLHLPISLKGIGVRMNASGIPNGLNNFQNYSHTWIVRAATLWQIWPHLGCGYKYGFPWQKSTLQNNHEKNIVIQVNLCCWSKFRISKMQL